MAPRKAAPLLVRDVPGSLEIRQALSDVLIASPHLPVASSLAVLDIPRQLREELLDQQLPLPRSYYSEAHITAIRRSLERHGFDSNHEAIVLAPLPQHHVPTAALDSYRTALVSLASTADSSVLSAQLARDLFLFPVSGGARMRLWEKAGKELEERAEQREVRREERGKLGRRLEREEARDEGLVQSFPVQVVSPARRNLDVANSTARVLRHTQHPQRLPSINGLKEALRDNGVALLLRKAIASDSAALLTLSYSKAAGLARLFSADAPELAPILLHGLLASIALFARLDNLLPDDSKLTIDLLLILAHLFSRRRLPNPLCATPPDDPSAQPATPRDTVQARSVELAESLERLRGQLVYPTDSTAPTDASATAVFATKNVVWKVKAFGESGLPETVNPDYGSAAIAIDLLVAVLRSEKWLEGVDALDEVVVSDILIGDAFDMLKEPPEVSKRGDFVGRIREGSPLAVQLEVFRSVFLRPFIEYLVAARRASLPRKSASLNVRRASTEDAIYYAFRPHRAIAAHRQAKDNGRHLEVPDDVVESALAFLLHLWKARYIIIAGIILAQASSGEASAFGKPTFDELEESLTGPDGGAGAAFWRSAGGLIVLEGLTTIQLTLDEDDDELDLDLTDLTSRVATCDPFIAAKTSVFAQATRTRLEAGNSPANDALQSLVSVALELREGWGQTARDAERAGSSETRSRQRREEETTPPPSPRTPTPSPRSSPRKTPSSTPSPTSSPLRRLSSTPAPNANPGSSSGTLPTSPSPPAQKRRTAFGDITNGGFTMNDGRDGRLSKRTRIAGEEEDEEDLERRVVPAVTWRTVKRLEGAVDAATKHASLRTRVHALPLYLVALQLLPLLLATAAAPDPSINPAMIVTHVRFHPATPDGQHLVRVLASPSIFTFVRDFFRAYSPLDVADYVTLLSDPPLEASAAASLLAIFEAVWLQDNLAREEERVTGKWANGLARFAALWEDAGGRAYTHSTEHAEMQAAAAKQDGWTSGPGPSARSRWLRQGLLVDE
ncbi:hypothetical protein OF846_000739 [Rhodotorula toruloides]|nr:hypothetical protein OF846_000739 [Rhodotorula toruloides]